MLYSFISTLKFNNKIHDMILLNYDLYYYYIQNEGSYDLQNLFEQIINKKEIYIWKGKTTKKVYLFITHILKAINFLHKNKIVHLDIKPENIIYNDLVNYSINKFGKRFKLIDFGFSVQEPFDNSLHNPIGTFGYMPTYYNNDEDWLPNNHPNDWSYKGHISLEHYGDKRYSLYKSDIYSFGRTIYYLDYLLNEDFYQRYIHYNYCWCLLMKKQQYQNQYISQLTYFMTKEKIENRYDINLCLKFINSNFT